MSRPIAVFALPTPPSIPQRQRAIKGCQLMFYVRIQLLSILANKIFFHLLIYILFLTELFHPALLPVSQASIISFIDNELISTSRLLRPSFTTMMAYYDTKQVGAVHGHVAIATCRPPVYYRQISQKRNIVTGEMSLTIYVEWAVNHFGLSLT